MSQKTNRILKSFVKFILYGSVRRNNTTQFIETPHHVNYYMTSVFPDKKTKDEVLKNLNQYEYQ